MVAKLTKFANYFPCKPHTTEKHGNNDNNIYMLINKNKILPFLYFIQKR
jgi:hypothetical protein